MTELYILTDFIHILCRLLHDYENCLLQSLFLSIFVFAHFVNNIVCNLHRSIYNQARSRARRQRAHGRPKQHRREHNVTARLQVSDPSPARRPRRGSGGGNVRCRYHPRTLTRHCTAAAQTCAGGVAGAGSGGSELSCSLIQATCCSTSAYTPGMPGRPQPMPHETTPSCT